jgi:hypothetical protein
LGAYIKRRLSTAKITNEQIVQFAADRNNKAIQNFLKIERSPENTPSTNKKPKQYLNPLPV